MCKNQSKVVKQAKQSSKAAKVKVLEINLRNKPYSCKICKASFKLLSKFQDHATKHLLKRVAVSRYACELCEQTFELYGKLETHMISHTGEKPHKCELCSKRFVQKQHMKRHISLCHSEKKPFKCPHCSNTFPTNDYLTQHSWVHSKEKRFSCDQCSKMFRAPYAVARHVKRCHNSSTVLK